MLKNTLGIILAMSMILGGIAHTESQTVINQNISSKQSDGKAGVAMPDQCLSPTSTPAGPVPVPYPNTATSSDTSKGNRKVKIGGKEIMLKDSHYKKSTGDEEGTTSTNILRQIQRK